MRLLIDEETPTGGKIQREDYKLSAHFAKKLSVKGNSERAEDAREYFTRFEEKAKQDAIDLDSLDPETKMLNILVQNITKQALEQKRQKQEQERQAKELGQVKESQKAIAQALMRLPREEFQTWVNRSLSSIEESEGYLYIGSRSERHEAARRESYERLNNKRPCRLDLKVANARGRAATDGATKSQINSINKLAVIEADKDLKPVYESVIKEMLIAYNVDIE